MRENRTYGSEGGVSRWLIPTPISAKVLPRLYPSWALPLPVPVLVEVAERVKPLLKL